MTNLTIRIAFCALLVGAATSSNVQAQWTQESLPLARSGMGSVGVDGKVLFAGGVDGPTVYDRVDIYDEATDTWLTPLTLSSPRIGPAAVAVGDYAIFAGGQEADFSASAVVDILHVPTMSWTSHTLSQARSWLSATTVGNKAIFAGGRLDTPTVKSDRVDIYDADLGLPHDSATWSWTTLSEARHLPAATSVGGLALFAGGQTASAVSDRVDIYDDSKGTWSTASLSQPRLLRAEAAASFGTRAHFAGGVASIGLPIVVSNVVDIYDAQTGAWTTRTLSIARSGIAAVTLDSKILFAGGFVGTSAGTDRVDVLDAGLGLWDPTTSLSQPRGGIVRAVVNGKGFFAGGSDIGVQSAVVDVYTPVVTGPWTGLGYALPGTHGDPRLLGSGPLTTGSAGSLTLTKAAGPGALAILFVSFASTPTPFKGGTLLTVPAFAQFGFGTVGSPGSVTLPWVSWPNGLSGVSLFFQYGIQDAGAPLGAALSNGLRADVP